MSIRLTLCVLLALGSLLPIVLTQAVNAQYAVHCERASYNVSEGDTVKVCLRFEGPLSMESDEDDVFVTMHLATQPMTADEADFTPVSVSPSTLQFSASNRGQVSLPCVEVITLADSRAEDTERLTVVINQTQPLQVVHTCLVHIVDQAAQGTTPPSQDGDSPRTRPAGRGTGMGMGQAQGQAGAIAGGVVGGVLGLAGFTVAVVTLIVVCILYCRHKKNRKYTSDGSTKSYPRPVVYKKNGDSDSSSSDVSERVKLQATPREPPTKPLENPVYAKEPLYANQTEDATPPSPMYSNLSSEEHSVVYIPEDYEVPISSRNQHRDEETELMYEVPLTLRSDSDESASGCGPSSYNNSQVDKHMYHTLEQPMYHTLEQPMYHTLEPPRV